MRRLFTTRSIAAGLIAASAVLVLIAGPVAMAQTGSGGTGSSMGSDKQGLPPAPVGHRQPRAGDVPSEKNLSNPNDPVNKEDAALDKKIKSICRGC
jgi:hypothetical protein